MVLTNWRTAALGNESHLDDDLDLLSARGGHANQPNEGMYPASRGNPLNNWLIFMKVDAQTPKQLLYSKAFPFFMISLMQGLWWIVKK